MPFFGGFTFVTDITLWRCWSTVSSSNNVPVAAVSATNDLHLCCSTFIRLLYWDSTSEYEETWLILSKVFPMSQSRFLLFPNFLPSYSGVLIHLCALHTCVCRSYCCSVDSWLSHACSSKRLESLHYQHLCIQGDFYSCPCLYLCLSWAC